MNINKIDELFNYYVKYGNYDYIGEPVSQVEHMVQAAMLAEKDGQSKDVILAALFHDIGHLLQLESKESETMGKYGIKNHEKIGANYLRDCGFKYPIPELVENHVKVKKYRTYKNPSYYNQLSEASKQTLKYQGGPMNSEEATRFELDPLFELSLKIRDYDDSAKMENIKINSIQYYKNMCL